MYLAQQPTAIFVRSARPIRLCNGLERESVAFAGSELCQAPEKMMDAGKAPPSSYQMCVCCSKKGAEFLFPNFSRQPSSLLRSRGNLFLAHGNLFCVVSVRPPPPRAFRRFHPSFFPPLPLSLSLSLSPSSFVGRVFPPLSGGYLSSN